MADFLTPPEYAVEAPSGPIWLTDDGILITINNFVTHTHENAVENLRITRELAAGNPRPLLVDISKVRSMSKQAREEYTRTENKEFCTAVALLTTSAVGSMIGNIFMALNKHVVPVKMFTDAHKAREWLLDHKIT